MIEINIPGHRHFRLKNLVLDFNGTVACDGQLLSGIGESLQNLSGKLHVHVLTADTFGKARSELRGVACEISVLPAEEQHIHKLEYVKRLGAEFTACIGNGRNDRLMLREAALGIAVVMGEGAAVEALTEADIICSDIFSALELISNPLRLVATLRS